MKTLAALILALIPPIFAPASDRPEYLDSYNPISGFKPAQRDLTQVFLQLAGSLEAHGSPVPYLRHVAAEHARVEALYRQKFAREPQSYRPTYMTDAYLEKLAANWNLLSPKLGLDAYARDFGDMMRDAIKGTRGNGTIVIEIFNQHQTRVFDQMVGKGNQPAAFEHLRTELVRRLEIGAKVIDDRAYSIERRDGVRYAAIIHGMTVELLKKLDGAANPDAASAIKTVLTSIVMDAGQAAHSELETAIAEWAINRRSTAAK